MKGVVFMDIQALEATITSIGFPIIMCLLMFYYVQKLNDKHDQEIDKLTEAMNQNTRILTELSSTITNMQLFHEKSLKRLEE